jgi:hypothetical protein
MTFIKTVLQLHVAFIYTYGTLTSNDLHCRPVAQLWLLLLRQNGIYNP